MTSDRDHPGQEDERRRQALHSLRYARGRYTAERAAQLSGIPQSTIYDWNRAGIYQPDYGSGRPMAWSYRDLVYLRVLAWLRSEKMPRPEAARIVKELKQAIADGQEIHELRADSRAFIPDDDMTAPLGGQSVLFAHMLEPFELSGAAIQEIGDRPIWGPDLVTPSRRTYISPWVLAGDPCIDATRIPTSAIYALRHDRGLDTADVLNLYSELTVAEVEEAFELEQRLHGHQAIAA